MCLSEVPSVSPFYYHLKIHKQTMQFWPKCIALLSDSDLNKLVENVPETRDMFGRSGLFYAVYMRKLWLIEKLIPHDATIQDMNGMTALMFAASSGFLDAVKLLAPLECSITDNHGYTALTYAIFHQNYQSAQIIMRYQIKRPFVSNVHDIVESLTQSAKDCANSINHQLLDSTNYIVRDVDKPVTIIDLDISENNALSTNADDANHATGHYNSSLPDSNENVTIADAHKPLVLETSDNIPLISVSTITESSLCDTSTETDQEDGVLEPTLRHDSITCRLPSAQQGVLEEPTNVLSIASTQAQNDSIHSLTNRIIYNPLFLPRAIGINNSNQLLDPAIERSLVTNTLFISPGWKFACNSTKMFSDLDSAELISIVYNHEDCLPLIPIVKIMAGIQISYMNTASRLNTILARDDTYIVKRFVQQNIARFPVIILSDREATIKFAFHNICLKSQNNIIRKAPLPVPKEQDSVEILRKTSNIDVRGILPEVSLSAVITLVHDTLFGDVLSSLSSNICLQYATSIVLGHYPKRVHNYTNDVDHFAESIMHVCPSYPESIAIINIIKPIVLQSHQDRLPSITFLASICACFKGHRLLWNYALQYFYRTLIKSRDINIPLSILIRQDRDRSKCKARDLLSLVFSSIQLSGEQLSQVAFHTPSMGFLDILRYIYKVHKQEKQEDHPEYASLNDDYISLMKSIINNTNNNDIASALYISILFKNSYLRDIILESKGRDFRDMKGRTPYMIESLCMPISMSIRIRVDPDGEIRHINHTNKRSTKESYSFVVPFNDLVEAFSNANISSFYCRVLLKSTILNLPLRIVHFFELYSSLDFVAFNSTLFELSPNYTPLHPVETDYIAVDSDGIYTLGYMMIHMDDTLCQYKNIIDVLTKTNSDNNHYLTSPDKRGWTLMMRLSLVKHTFLYITLFNVLNPKLLRAQTLLGETALMIAVKANNPLAVTYLLLNNEGRMQTSHGMTAFMFALRQTDLSADIIWSLLTEECCIQDNDGNTALMHLCLISNCDMESMLPPLFLQELISKEGNLTNNQGMTPLMFLLIGYALREKFARSNICHLQSSHFNSYALELTDESIMSSDSNDQLNTTTSTAHMIATHDEIPVDQFQFTEESVLSQESTTHNQYSPPSGVDLNRFATRSSPSHSLDFIFLSLYSEDSIYSFPQSDDSLDSSDDSEFSNMSFNTNQSIVNNFQILSNPVIKNIFDEETFMSSYTAEQELVKKITTLVGKEGYNIIMRCLRGNSFEDGDSEGKLPGLADIFIKKTIELKSLSVNTLIFQDLIYKSDMHGNRPLDYCMESQYLTNIVLTTALSKEISEQSLSLVRQGVCKFISRCYKDIDSLTQSINDVSQEKEKRMKGLCYELFEAFFSQFDIGGELTTSINTYICSQQKRIEKLCQNYIYSNTDLSDVDSFHGKCVICMSRNKEVCIVPCGHMVYCRKCSHMDENKNAQCPLCRKKCIALITPILLLENQLSNSLDVRVQKKRYKWLIDKEVYVIDDDSN